MSKGKTDISVSLLHFGWSILARLHFYTKDALLDRWKEFIKISKREGSSASEKLTEFFCNYVAHHSHGNPQTLLTRYSRDLAPNDPRFDCVFYFPAHNWCSCIQSPCSAETCPRKLFGESPRSGESKKSV